MRKTYNEPGAGEADNNGDGYCRHAGKLAQNAIGMFNHVVVMVLWNNHRVEKCQKNDQADTENMLLQGMLFVPVHT